VATALTLTAAGGVALAALVASIVGTGRNPSSSTTTAPTSVTATGVVRPGRLPGLVALDRLPPLPAGALAGHLVLTGGSPGGCLVALLDPTTLELDTRTFAGWACDAAADASFRHGAALVTGRDGRLSLTTYRRRRGVTSSEPIDLAANAEVAVADDGTTATCVVDGVGDRTLIVAAGHRPRRRPGCDARALGDRIVLPGDLQLPDGHRRVDLPPFAIGRSRAVAVLVRDRERRRRIDVVRDDGSVAGSYAFPDDAFTGRGGDVSADGAVLAMVYDRRGGGSGALVRRRGPLVRVDPDGVGPRRVAVAPDGRFLALQLADLVVIVEAATLRPRWRVPGGVTLLAWIP
jgi:hypothetical protein